MLKNVDKKENKFMNIRIDVNEKDFPEVRKWLINDKVRIELIGNVKHIREQEDYDTIPMESGKGAKKSSKPSKKYIYASVQAEEMEAERVSKKDIGSMLVEK